MKCPDFLKVFETLNVAVFTIWKLKDVHVVCIIIHECFRRMIHYFQLMNMMMAACLLHKLMVWESYVALFKIQGDGSCRGGGGFSVPFFNNRNMLTLL